jgi:hypothetical protein
MPLVDRNKLLTESEPYDGDVYFFLVQDFDPLMSCGRDGAGIRQRERDVLIARPGLLLASTAARNYNILFVIYLIDRGCCYAGGGQRRLPEQFPSELIETPDLLVPGGRDEQDAPAVTAEEPKFSLPMWIPLGDI